MRGLHLRNSGTPIARDRLTAVFASAEGTLASFLLIEAPAGYGKRVLVDQLLERARVNDPRVCKVECAQGPASNFWEVLSRALSRDIAQLPDGNGCSPEELSHLYLQEMTEPFVLVLTEYHHASSAETDRSVASLGEHNPNVSVIVVAEHTRLLDGPLLKGRVQVVQRSDLVFRPAEIIELAEARGMVLGDTLPTEVEVAAGWPILVDALLRVPTSQQAATINRFALDHLELLEEEEKTILLAASLLDSMSAEHAAALIEKSGEATFTHRTRLQNLGLLVAFDGTPTERFYCHPAVKTTFVNAAHRLFSQRDCDEIVRVSAGELRNSEPLAALRSLVSIGALQDAEMVLAGGFLTLVAQPDMCLPVLRLVSETDLLKYPTFAAARLYMQSTAPGTSEISMNRLRVLMRSGASRRLETELDPEVRIVTLVLLMVAERSLGNARAALSITQELESSILVSSQDSPQSSKPLTARDSLAGLPEVLSEMALTAMMCGDGELAKRIWTRLLADLRSTQPGPASALRLTETAAEKYSMEWEIGALGGLALVEAYDGNLIAAAAHLGEADSMSQRTGLLAPHLAWANGEIARAHIATEHCDEAMMQQSRDRLEPLRDRLEQWPMLLMAKLEMIRYQRGPSWAMPELEAYFERSRDEQHSSGVWSAHLVTYRIFINTVVGKFTTSEALLHNFSAENPFARIERARLLMYSGNNVQALLTAQQIAADGIPQRQDLDRNLLLAVAAWSCGFHDEAFVALRAAVRIIDRCGLSMMLRNVPFDEMCALAEAARAAGECDVTELVAQIPLFARCRRSEPLTEMEQRALDTMLTHPSLLAAAKHLFIAPATLKRHRLAVYRKLDVGNRQEAILQATRMGLLQH